VTYTRADGRKCHGAFVKASGYTVVATVAHCLSNYSTGGLTLPNGERSIAAFVPDAVELRGDRNDNDFALVVFSGSRQGATLDRSTQTTGSSATVVLDRYGRKSVVTTTIKGYTSNRDRTHNIFLSTSNQAGMVAGDSGSPLYNSQGALIGVLRGCVPDLCGFTAVYTGNPAANEVFSKLSSSYPGILASARPAPSRPNPSRPSTRPNTPPQQRYYECSSQCRIDYGGYKPDTAVVTVNYGSIRASSSYDARSRGLSGLKSYCQEYCDFSRDAVRCTLIGAVSCR